MHASAKADEALRPFAYPARTLPPPNHCPKCGDSYRATVCPICKIPIGPALPGGDETGGAGEEAEEKGKEKYPCHFYI